MIALTQAMELRQTRTTNLITSSNAAARREARVELGCLWRVTGARCSWSANHVFCGTGVVVGGCGLGVISTKGVEAKFASETEPNFSEDGELQVRRVQNWHDLTRFNNNNNK
jgi:hypothetical protein